MKNIFSYDDYRKFVLDTIASSENGERGQRVKLAVAARCQVSHVTAVLGGHAHFSAEQAFGVSQYLGLGDREFDFFMMLVQLSRASTEDLRKYLRRSISYHRNRARNLKTRLKMEQSLSETHGTVHYSTWIHGAIHALISIPAFKTREALAAHLKVPMDQVDKSLHHLVEAGLAVKSGMEYQVGPKFIHLDRDSPHIGRHHINWRLRAISAVENMSADSLHYSSVVSLSKADFAKVRDHLVASLQQNIETIKSSNEEQAASLCIDFFKI